MASKAVNKPRSVAPRGFEKPLPTQDAGILETIASRGISAPKRTLVIVEVQEKACCEKWVQVEERRLYAKDGLLSLIPPKPGQRFILDVLEEAED